MQLSLVYFPYLNMEDVDEIDFGFAKVWNFDRKKDSYINDPKIKAKIQKILNTHVSYKRTVKDIGVFSMGLNDFHELSSAESEQLRIVRILLFLCVIAKANTTKKDSNTGHRMATAENFDVIVQRFDLANDYISESAGEIVRFLSGGFTLDEITFQKPSYVPTPSLRMDFDNELLRILLDIKNKKYDLFEKIINAGEMFLQGYFNTYYVSGNARILLQMSAFEILLSLPEIKPREHFKNIIEGYSNLPSETTYTYLSERGSGTPASETRTIKGMWADMFYTLRNHIIHGSNPPITEFIFRNTQTHIDISPLFFILSIRKKIEEAFPECTCDYEIKWEQWVDDLRVPPVNREGFVYKRSFRKLWESLIVI